MPVVIVEPGLERCLSVIRGLVGVSVGPFAQGGLDEAFGLAVGFGRVRSGTDVLEVESFAGIAERCSATNWGSSANLVQPGRRGLWKPDR